jgi:hypothetical protein
MMHDHVSMQYWMPPFVNHHRARGPGHVYTRAEHDAGGRTFRPVPRRTIGARLGVCACGERD